MTADHLSQFLRAVRDGHEIWCGDRVWAALKERYTEENLANVKAGHCPYLLPDSLFTIGAEAFKKFERQWLVLEPTPITPSPEFGVSVVHKAWPSWRLYQEQLRLLADRCERIGYKFEEPPDEPLVVEGPK